MFSRPKPPSQISTKTPLCRAPPYRVLRAHGVGALRVGEGVRSHVSLGAGELRFKITPKIGVSHRSFVRPGSSLAVYPSERAEERLSRGSYGFEIRFKPGQRS